MQEIKISACIRNPEAVVVVLVIRVVVVTVPNLQVVSIVVPASAPFDTVRAI
jgi:hypothetical protein